LIVLLSAVVTVDAQQRGGRFGGFGGFGNNASTATSSEYNNNGTVGNATFSVDPDTHSIVVIADQETSRQISEVLSALDRPKPQVLLNCVFMEVQHNNSSDIGVEGGWTKGIGNGVNGNAAQIFGLSGLNSVVTNFNAVGGQTFSTALTAGSTAGTGGLYQILGSDFQATLRAIAQSGKAQLLSRPSILARDGQPATIVVGQQVPLITGVNYTTFGNQINTVTYTDVGIILKVTPFVSANGYVEMIVQPQASSVDPNLNQTISAGVTAPYIDVRSADTVVITPDGQTVVIGGLMENDKATSDSKIPILGDIPLLGNLFKSRSKSDTKSELLIFLTPHIVPAPSQLAALSSKVTHQSELITNSVSEHDLNRFLEQVPAKEKQ